MVGLQTLACLLAITLATGSALASPNKYQRHSELDNQVQSRVSEPGVALPDRHIRYGLAVARYHLLPREFVDDEDHIFVRDLDVFDDLEAREPLGFKSAGKLLRSGANVANNKHNKYFLDGVDYGQHIVSTFQSRGLEDNEELYGRDLDAEELFQRGYDLLDERDIVYDLD